MGKPELGSICDLVISRVGIRGGQSKIPVLVRAHEEFDFRAFRFGVGVEDDAREHVPASATTCRPSTCSRTPRH
jgi:hypothetical protein